VDADDLAVFESCISGPAVVRPPECADRDFDADMDVDQNDFGVFQRCHSGALKAADPDCAN
jgi:hypothetical protein